MIGALKRSNIDLMVNNNLGKGVFHVWIEFDVNDSYIPPIPHRKVKDMEVFMNIDRHTQVSIDSFLKDQQVAHSTINGHEYISIDVGKGSSK